MQQCIMILLFLILNEAQNVSSDTPPIIRSLKLHKQPLFLHNTVESCRTCSCWTLSGSVRVRQPSTVLCKTRGCLCSFRLLMMGGVSPETCWASFKIRNNKILIHCCILLGLFCKNCTTMHGSTNIKCLVVLPLWDHEFFFSLMCLQYVKSLFVFKWEFSFHGHSRGES
jgi:hypothetical protein